MEMGIGIIGCGNISSAYLRLAPLFKGLNVRGVADVNMEVAENQAAAFNTTAYSVDDLLARGDIDVVINLTIPAVHFAVTRSILQAGKHAYSEKPLVLTLAEGEELRALAKSKKLRVGCAPDTFFGSAHQQARDLIDSGKLGQITTGNAAIQAHGPESWHPNPAFFYQPGAGPIMDMGPYYICLLYTSPSPRD